jgi:ribosome-binding factor A
MTGKSHHGERLAEMLRIELAQIIEGEVRDPRVGLATVTEVRLAQDGRHARVFVAVPGGEEQEQATLKGLVAAGGFMRHQLAEALSLRYTPELTFILDHSEEQHGRVDELLKRIDKANSKAADKAPFKANE